MQTVGIKLLYLKWQRSVWTCCLQFDSHFSHPHSFFYNYYYFDSVYIFIFDHWQLARDKKRSAFRSMKNHCGGVRRLLIKRLFSYCTKNAGPSRLHLFSRIDWRPEEAGGGSYRYLFYRQPPGKREELRESVLPSAWNKQVPTLTVLLPS